MTALGRSFAAQLAGLEHALADMTADGPDSAFARWAGAVSDTPLPMMTALRPLDAIPQARWAEAPMLAAVGFRAATTTSEATAAADDWLAGFRRLMARDPVPADRNSFLFRPTELLGLAAGTTTFAAVAEEPRDWLLNTLDTHRHRISTAAVWQRVMYELTRRQLGLPPTTVGGCTATSTFDTGVLFWSHLIDGALTSALTSLDEAALRRELLSGAATEDIHPQGLAETAVVWIALHRAVAAAVGLLAGRPPEPAQFVARLCRNFLQFATELTIRYGGRAPFGPINDEYDVQDLFRAMLRLHFADVRPEEWTPSYGAIHSRTDFLLKPERVVVETKMTRKGLGQRDVVQQLTVDKAQYKAHPDCGTLVCFVYDPSRLLTNPVALERDLSDVESNLRTIVVVSSTAPGVSGPNQ